MLHPAFRMRCGPPRGRPCLRAGFRAAPVCTRTDCGRSGCLCSASAGRIRAPLLEVTKFQGYTTNRRFMTIRYRHRIQRAAEILGTAGDWIKRDRISPPIEATTEIGRLLWTDPAPLIHPGHRFIVVFSAKSACTNVLIWFLTQLGHARAARDFHLWPHEYRTTVYYYSELYRKAFRSDVSGFKVIRIVRDPFERTASSFRHVVRYSVVDREIEQRVGRRSMDRDGLSFSEFLTFLEGTDLRSCDPHLAIQHHPIEDRLRVDYLINISRENLFERLNKIETELDLKPTNLPKDRWVKALRAHNRPDRRLDETADIYTRRLTREQASVGPWPDLGALLSDDARARIAKLYAKDIECYF
jgi:hypothetical protein